jgi:hypothetical protein
MSTEAIESGKPMSSLPGDMHRLGPFADCFAQHYLCSADVGKEVIVDSGLHTASNPPGGGIPVGSACFTAASARLGYIPQPTLLDPAGMMPASMATNRYFTTVTVGVMPAALGGTSSGVCVEFPHVCCYHHAPPPFESGTFNLEWDNSCSFMPGEHAHGILSLHAPLDSAAHWKYAILGGAHKVMFLDGVFPTHGYLASCQLSRCSRRRCWSHCPPVS